MKAENPNVGCRFDSELARKLLKQAGYESSQKFPEVTFGFNTLLQHTMVASNIQAQWRTNLGINVRLDNMEWKVYLQKVRDDPPQIFRMGWVADYPDPDSFMKVFISSGGNNFTRWRNPKYDQLVTAASTERDDEKRRALYDLAQKILLEDDCVIIPVFVAQINRMVSPRIEGFKVNPMDSIFLERLSFRRGGELAR
jgi:oligopeptide transport system substrate-binding protein